jgi:hypothetical protein
MSSMGHSSAMIAARSRSNARSRNITAQQVIKRATGFEGAGMLEHFQLQIDGLIQAEGCAINGENRGLADMGFDQAMGMLDIVLRRKIGHGNSML